MMTTKSRIVCGLFLLDRLPAATKLARVMVRSGRLFLSMIAHLHVIMIGIGTGAVLEKIEPYTISGR